MSEFEIGGSPPEAVVAVVVEGVRSRETERERSRALNWRRGE